MTNRKELSVLRAAGGILLWVGGLAGMRWLAGRRLMRSVGLRLPVGPDGIIPGAQPIRLRGEGRRALLMLHGFGDTPRTLGYLAAEAHARGYAVHAPLLPGHGRTVREFARSTAADWFEAARAALQEVAAEYDRVGVVGLSMGGAVAVRLAAGNARVSALALAAPYCDAPRPVRELARYRVLVSTVIPFVDGRNEQSILDPDERSRSLGYGLTTPRLLSELVRTADAARAALPSVSVPTLIVQSRADNRVAPAVAEMVLRELGAAEKRLEWMDEGGHIITVDRGRERVITEVLDWMDRWTAAPGG